MRVYQNVRLRKNIDNFVKIQKNKLLINYIRKMENKLEKQNTFDVINICSDLS